MQWGVNKGVNPYQFGANINGTWSNLGTVSPTGTWTLTPSSISVSGNISAASVKTNTSLASFLSTSFGPDGLGWIRYGATTAPNYNHYRNTANHQYILAATAAMIDSPGSGFFGPAYAESGILTSAQKDNYLTSSVEGEIDTINCIATQNKKGDVACLLANVTKVRSGSGDTGGALGAEFGTYMRNPSGTILNEVHNIPALVESAAGVSGGSGYGSWNESWVGTNFAGVYVGAYKPSDPATGWIYAFAAANDRTNSNWYFRVIGDKFFGTNRPGDIIQGYQATQKILRNDSGTFQIRDTADSASLFSVTNSGAATILSSLNIGTNGTTTGTFGLANGGASGATATVQNIAATSAYNFNLPATAGTSTYLLTSAGGGSSEMTWTIPTTTVNGVSCTLGSTCSVPLGTIALPATVSGATSGGIPYFNSTTQMSSSALLAANALMIGGGAGVAPSTTTTGTGVVTAIGNNTNTAGGLVVPTAALGSGQIVLGGGSGASPTTSANASIATGDLTLGAAGTQGSVTMGGSTSGTLQVKPAATAGTGSVLTLPGGTTDFSATGGTSQVVRQSTAGGALTVSQLAASDLSNGTTGSNAVVLATSPTLVTPVLGAATGTSLALGTTLTSGQTFTNNGSASVNGYLNTLSTAAALNSSVGDIQGNRLSLGASPLNLGSIGAALGVNTNISIVAAANYGMYFGPTYSGTINSSSAYGSIVFPSFNLTGGAGSNTISTFAAYAAGQPAITAGNVTNNYAFWALSSFSVGSNNIGFRCDMTSSCFYNGSTSATNTFAGKTRIGATTAPTNSLDVTGDINATTGYRVNGTLAVSATAPTISSGFGTTPSVTANNGTAAFRINVGTGGTATNGVVGLPTAANGWNCFASDITTPATGHTIKQTATSTTSVTLTNYNNAGTATAWTASDIIIVNCMAY